MIFAIFLLDAEQSEAVLDLLAQRDSGKEGQRIVVLPVEATLPRVDPEPDDVADSVLLAGLIGNYLPVAKRLKRSGTGKL